MKFYTIIAFLFFCTFVAAQSEKYSRAKILLQGKSITELYQLGIDVEHGEYGKEDYLIGDFSAAELALIATNGFQYKVLIEDVKGHYVAQNSNLSLVNLAKNPACEFVELGYQTPVNFSLGSMGGYLTYQEMLDNLDSMAAKYPNLTSPRQAISSTLTHEGRPIYWLRISDNPSIDETGEPEALYTALHHAREPGSLSQVIFYMWYLLENYNTNSEIQYLVDNTELYFVPCVNPDGYIYNEVNDPNGGGLWRKNRRNNGNGSFGVDLNRNYGYQWGFDNTGSSPNPNSNTYRGPSAFSEPETQNIRDFCAAHEFKMALNYHTYGNLLIYPWAYSDVHTVDSTVFVNFSAYMTAENNYLTGTGTETVGYVVNGDTDDFMYGDTTTKPQIFSMTPEAGPDVYGFWPPSFEIERICKENFHQNLAMPRLLLNFGIAEEQTNALLSSKNTKIKYNLKRLGFSNAPLTVSLTPITSNIQSVGASVAYMLQQFETIEDSISIILVQNIQLGDSVIFVLEVDNGFTTQSDTIRKIYGGQTQTFSDNGSNLSSWTNSGNTNWGTTTNDFYSAPRSITDSPNGNYNAAVDSRLTLTNPVDLVNVTESAILRFWAKWDIEAAYDYAQVQISTDGTTFTPLCGKYSKLGTPNQDEDEPLYDGKQNSWVQEEIDISGYVGNQIYIQFSFNSDFFVEEDGFYFDDVEVLTFDSLSTNVKKLNATDFVLQNFPNPAIDYTTISIEKEVIDFTNIKLVIHNTVGQTVYNELINKNKVKINTQNWSSGIYYYYIETAEGISERKKMIVVR